ncbi:alpha/beta hydrolase [Microbacterium hominis]|uniref:Alpha/beta hydrolase n=1 Tax=Microbacterium hominis TaxID=162426 RepID=A0A7D4TIS0_9MICO|nr:alpha/beta hydrolase [Microbacterium hominis]QKJ20881.1 alpha/beta hydrolase [Microbacterium hominis]
MAAPIVEIDFAQPEGFRPLSLDLRVPERPEAPLVVFFHGGGFLRGTRRVFTPGVATADSFDRIVGGGLAIASCEYRLSGEARFPAQLDDAAAAIDWLHEHGSEYGVDPARMVLWGVSAGATIAALTALRREDVRGVVDWFGPTELFAMAARSDGEPQETREARWLGAPAVTVPDRARAASPALMAHAGAPPFHIAHGTDDAHVPFEQSELLAAALAREGVPVELRRVAGGRHFWEGLDTGPLFDDAIAFVHRVAL